MTKTTGLAFQKFAARNATTNEITKFILRPITIPLARMSRIQILNLLQGNNLRDREQLSRRASTSLTRKSPVVVVAPKASKVVKTVATPRVSKVVKPRSRTKSKSMKSKAKTSIPGLLKITQLEPRSSPGMMYTVSKSQRPPPRPRKAGRDPEMPVLQRMTVPPIRIKQEPIEMTVPVNPISFMSSANMEDSGMTPNRASENQIVHSIFGSDHACPVCDETFSNYDDLLIHRRSHRNSYNCELCPKNFDRESLLRAHFKTHYNLKNCSNQGKVIIGDRVLKKRGLPLTKSRFLSLTTPAHPDFNFDAFTPLTLVELSNHYACDACGEAFAEKDSLKQHYLSHFGLVPTTKPTASTMAPPPSPVVQSKVVPAIPAEDQAQSSRSASQPLEPLIVTGDGSIVPFSRHVSSFEVPPTPSPSSSSSKSQSSRSTKKDIMSYEETLIQAERIKKFAFTSNDSALLNKMLEVESHVAGKIMAARVKQSYSPSEGCPSP